MNLNLFFFSISRFAIVWIPLLLLAIFNTVLISYVRRSKQTTQQDKEGGVELRRHNRTSQVEQRKTTIMLSMMIFMLKQIYF